MRITFFGTLLLTLTIAAIVMAQEQIPPERQQTATSAQRADGISIEVTSESPQELEVLEAKNAEDSQRSSLPLTIVTSDFVRFEFRDNFEGVGRTSSDKIRFRTRFGLQTDPIDVGHDLKLVIRFVPQASGDWEAGGDTLEDASLELHEGLISFGNDCFTLEVGRMELAYGDHVVIGNVGWHPTARSFDAIRLRLNPKKVHLDLFGSLITEGGTPKFIDGDLFFVGTYASFGELFNETMAFDVYLLGQLRHADESNAVDSLVRITIGSRVKNRVGMLDYRLEAGLQTGKNAGAKILAGQADLEIGMNLIDDKFRASLEGAFASGDDPGTDRNEAYSQLYPTAHKWLGFSDIIGGRSNIVTGVLHLSTTPCTRWKFYLDSHLFARPKPDLELNGGEFDIGAIFTIGKGLKTRAGYSLFIPANDAFASADPAHFTELELRYDY